MSKNLEEKVNFGIVRYANCWEDAHLLLHALKPTKGDRILSIASGGDNSFSLLCNDPEVVIAVDISLPQLHLIELKYCAIKLLERNEIISFLGFTPGEKRMDIFDKIKVHLSPAARSFWEGKLPDIKSGIIHSGKFEKYFQLFVRRILPLVHSQKTVNDLLAAKTAQEQVYFYNHKWNNWRWRILFKIFFSKILMGNLGRDKAFLAEVKVKVGPHIFNRAEQELQSVHAQQNGFLRYALTAGFGDWLPHYLRKEIFFSIKENIHKLQLQHAPLDRLLLTQKKFDCMNLSNIFEYMNPRVFKNTGTIIINSIAKKGRIAYWNLMVPRSLAVTFPENLLRENTSLLLKHDEGFFYDRFNLDVAHES